LLRISPWATIIEDVSAHTADDIIVDRLTLGPPQQCDASSCAVWSDGDKET
jgi:hypothetical protein